jgi:hypothetical protein
MIAAIRRASARVSDFAVRVGRFTAIRRALAGDCAKS